jgi:heterodisulfide reductase subunit A2
MMDVGRHPNVDVYSYSEVVGLEGEPGAFRATVRTESRYVDMERCVACGDCVDACPQYAPSAFDMGLGANKAIYRPFPQSVPSCYLIDREACLNADLLVCSRCADACQRDAIDFDIGPKIVELEVGSVIVAAGFDEYDPRALRHYGYGIHEDVLTALEFERLLNASGPTQGEIVRPSDGEHPKRIAFIQCVGSRGEGGRESCSRFCCTNSLKDALLTRQHLPTIEDCAVYFTDLRTVPKGCEAFAKRVEKEPDVRLVRGRPSRIDEVDGHLEILVEDTYTGKAKKELADMVVLASAAVPSQGLKTLADRLGMDVAPDGYLSTGRMPVETTRHGVYLCGGVSGPRTIPESVAQASAAAARAAEHMTDARLPEPEEDAPVDPHIEIIDPSGPPRIGVFVCHCGVNIAGVVDVGKVAESVKDIPGVVFVREELFACSEGSQRAIMETIRDEKLTRVVVSACTPRTHEPVFRSACEDAGLNPYLLEMVNIRDQCSWVHAAEPEEATARAVDQVRMAIARAAELEPLEPSSVSVTSQGLVIGGGAAGIACAIGLSRLGVPVALIEASDDLGGRLSDPGLDRVEPSGRRGNEILTYLRHTLKDSDVEVLTGTKIKSVSGAIGNFDVTLTSTNGGAEKTREMKVGALALAAGADLYDPKGHFGFGKYAGVITNQDLAGRIEKKKIPKAKSAVFIQCVGSRGHDGNDWCSGVCCPTTVRQARQLREQGLNVTVLHRGIRAAGRGLEEEYRLARQEGVLFVRYRPESLPEVMGKKKITGVCVQDPLLRREIEFPADLVVLACGLVPREPSTAELHEAFKVPLSAEGFLSEKHPELAPVETVVDGVMICGTIGGGSDLAASVGQGLGAAAKMAGLLGHSRLELDAALAEVNQDLCRGCGLCTTICDFHAPVLEMGVDGEEKARIIAAVCKGCGTCAAFCPTGAIAARHFTDRQILAMVDAALAPGGAT